MAYQTVNPANNQLIKTYPAHSDADVEAALQQADALYHSAWAKGDIEPRLAVLHKLADLIDSRSLIIHLCGAKKNKIHRNPGHCHVRLPLPDSFADGSQRSNGGADG